MLNFMMVNNVEATASSGVKEIPYLKTRWILDSGATNHVCNDRRRFITFMKHRITLQTGDTSAQVVGRGTVQLTGRNPETGEARTITLTDALYAPDFHVSLVSYGKLKRKGVHWCQDTDTLLDCNRIPIISMTQAAMDLFVIDEPYQVGRKLYKKPIDDRSAHQAAAHAVRSSRKPLREAAPASVWHRRFAHLSPKAVLQLEQMVDGIEFEDKTFEENCPTCRIAHAPRQISRRPIGQSFGKYGRVHFDLIQIEPLGYNGHKWISHFYIEGVRFHWAMTHAKKNECQLAIENFIAMATTWWNLPIRVFHYDNERSAGQASEYYLASAGIVVHHSPPGQPEQNPFSERASGTITARMRRQAAAGDVAGSRDSSSLAT